MVDDQVEIGPWHIEKKYTKLSRFVRNYKMPFNLTLSHYPHLYGGNKYLCYLKSPTELSFRITKEKGSGTE